MKATKSCLFCKHYYDPSDWVDDQPGNNPSCQRWEWGAPDRKPNFDRTIERDCCQLHMWRVAEVDEEVNQLIKDGVYNDTFDESVRRFKEMYGVG